MLLLCFKFVHEYLQKFRIWEDIRLKERQGQKRSLEARADAFSRLKICNESDKRVTKFLLSYLYTVPGDTPKLM